MVVYYAAVLYIKANITKENFVYSKFTRPYVDIIVRSRPSIITLNEVLFPRSMTKQKSENAKPKEERKKITCYT